MAAMSAQVWFLVVMMMMMMMKKSYAASEENITVSRPSGEAVLLNSGVQMKPRWDIRWTHHHLLLTTNRTVCHHRRCELMSDGSLSFSRVQPEDSGSYTLEVFDEGGKLKKKKNFLLQVEDYSNRMGGSVSLNCLFLMLLLLPFIIVFILRRRRTHRTAYTGQKEENVYVVMLARRGNKGKGEDEEKQDEEEECPYVPCHPDVPMETVEDIYV